MKKIISAVIFCLMFIPVAQAATLFSQNTNSFNENETKDLWPITVTAESTGEITAKNGINLVIDSQGLQMLWDAVPALTASGTAVDHQKIAASVSVQYINDYSVLHIPVLADFTAGENVTFNGMRLRAYHYSFGSRRIGLDINGDYIMDFEDINKMEVLATLASDQTAPYPPTNFIATVAPDLKSVSLSWKNPPDFDLIGMILDRHLTRAGKTTDSNLFYITNLTSYVDTDVQVGDVITYKLYASDNINFSDKVENTVEIKAIPAPIGNPPVVILPPDDTQKTELDLLNRLYSYYKVRYAIKCRAGVPANDSACLWVKVDLVYAQDLISKTDVKASLSAREIGYIKAGLKWAQDRYQTKCVDAATPDKTCTALGQSLKRANYFIK